MVWIEEDSELAGMHVRHGKQKRFNAEFTEVGAQRGTEGHRDESWRDANPTTRSFLTSEASTRVFPAAGFHGFARLSVKHPGLFSLPVETRLPT